MGPARHFAALAAGCVGLAAGSLVHAQEPRDGADPVGPIHGFEIEADAREALHTLWTSSLAAGAERVACIGGARDHGVAYITRVLPLEPSAADSMGVSASASIERCGPPQWFGTAHTHIAHRRGQRPYSMFSGADRGVIRLWLTRWTGDGVFCLLYSATDAHCETEGASGSLIAGPETGTSY
jgi:hypothetical protein